MTLSNREFWTAVHGMLLGAGFLLAFTGCFVSLLCLRPEWATPAGQAAGSRVLLVGSWAMATLAWLTVIVGTFVVYPWYRAAPPPGSPAASLADYPKALLISSPRTADWHEFGMEWKEHVGWLAPIFATAVAVVATTCRRALLADGRLRSMMMVLLTAAFFAATVAGSLGAFIDKVAPVR